MNIYTRLISLLVLLMALYVTTAVSQDNEPALPSQTDTEEATTEVQPSQEVEINEDNYRQFMELKDALQQRTILPENSYQSQAGLQKLDKLPEDSQKHLRNQLREIIVQGDRWQPGDEQVDYPYVPSEAAATNRALQGQEAEAWGELVDNYHAREAETYANSLHSRAAADTGMNTGTGNGEGTTADGKEQGSEGQQAGQQSGSDQSTTADSFAPGRSGDPNAQSAQGVSQNAMEFLQKSGQVSASSGGSSTNSPGGASESETYNTEGVSQNALEYLMGDGAQSETDSADTLTIEDLAKARGISVQIGVDTTPDDAGDEEKSDQNTPDKDGDKRP